MIKIKIPQDKGLRHDLHSREGSILSPQLSLCGMEEGDHYGAAWTPWLPQIALAGYTPVVKKEVLCSKDKAVSRAGWELGNTHSVHPIRPAATDRRHGCPVGCRDRFAVSQGGA